MFTPRRRDYPGQVNQAQAAPGRLARLSVGTRLENWRKGETTMKTRLILSLALLLLCTGAGAALAQTPDDLPPALETVCDMESGAAYGLCNAYCEAMDCDSDNPSASETACSKVKNKFTNITGRDLPCAAAICPCEGIPEWEAVLAGETLACIGGGGGPVIFLGTTTGVAAANAEIGLCGAIEPPPGFLLPITPEQGAVCLALLEARCTPE
jgi:hypothetical protein